MRMLLLTNDTAAPVLLTEAVAARGHEVLTCTRPAAALSALAAATEPCPVLLVFGADAADAAALCRQVRAFPSPVRCHLLATFPAATATSLRALVEAGADDVLPYPPAPDLLDLRLAVAERRRDSLRAAEEVLRMERAHRESEERYRSLFDGMPVGLYSTTPKGELLDANPTLVRLLGYPDRETLLRANSADMYLHPEDRLRWQRAVEATGTPQAFETQIRRRDGVVIWVRFSVRGVLGEDGRVVRYEGAMEDVTDRRRAEEALRESEERFRALVQNASDMIAVLTAEGRMRYGSPSHERVLGHRPEEYVGRSLLGLFHPDDRGQVTEFFARLVARPEEVLTLEARVLHHDGSYRVIETTGSNLLAHPAVLGIILNSHDITDRKRAEEGLRHAAVHDVLTGLPNRAFFMERLKAALAEARRDPGRPATVLFLDLDHFKIVNDSLGHPVGDELLVQIAALLTAALRPADVLSRVGGDEFAILLGGGCDLAEAERVAERIHGALAAPISLGGHEVFITASLGIAVCTPDYERPEDLLRDADTAMYRAKASGRACHVVFHSRSTS